MGKKHRVLCIDANNILIRAIKATERQEMSADGVATGGLHVFISMLSKYVRRIKPDRLVACWDGGRSRFRVQVFDGYKSARHERTEDEDERSPFSLAKEFLTLCNIHHVEHEGVEADDLVAAYWRSRYPDDDFYILSGDKDFLQLLGPGVKQVRPGGGLEEEWTESRVLAEMGCKPHQLTFVMALTGDPGDGVPGVQGIGVKTACKLLAKYDWDLHALISSDEKRIVGQRDVVLRNLKLVDLRSLLDPTLSVMALSPFEPTDNTGMMWQPLLNFVSMYRLSSVRDRLTSATLWRDRDG